MSKLFKIEFRLKFILKHLSLCTRLLAFSYHVASNRSQQNKFIESLRAATRHHFWTKSVYYNPDNKLATSVFAVICHKVTSIFHFLHNHYEEAYH